MKRPTTTELANKLGVTSRTIQKTAKTLDIPKKKGQYSFDANEVYQIIFELTNDHERTETIVNEFTNEPHRTNEPHAKFIIEEVEAEPEMIIEEFTPQEYEKLQEVIEEYKIKRNEVKHLLDQVSIYKNQLEYLKLSLDKKDAQMNSLISTFQKHLQATSERNHLDYLDKTK